MREYAVWFPRGGCTDRVVESGSRTGHVREEGRILSGLDRSSHGSLCGMRMAFGTALDQMVDKTNKSIKASENKLPLAVSKFVHVHPVVGKELTAGVGKHRKLFEKDLCMLKETL